MISDQERGAADIERLAFVIGRMSIHDASAAEALADELLDAAIADAESPHMDRSNIRGLAARRLDAMADR